MAVALPTAPNDDAEASSERTGLERWLPFAVLVFVSLSTVSIALLLFRPAGLLFAPWMRPPSLAGHRDIGSWGSIARLALVGVLLLGQSAAAALLLPPRRAARSARGRKVPAQTHPSSRG